MWAVNAPGLSERNIISEGQVSSAMLQRFGIFGAATMLAAGSLAITSLALASLALPAPASAQGYSDGHKFLQAVEKRERNEAIEMATKPGSTVVNARDISSGRSAMHIAVARRDTEWVQLLLGLKGNPDLADNRGVTPLMLAVQQGWVEGLQLLLSAGKVKVDAANDAGETPLIYAVHRRDIPMIRTLLKAGASPNRADNSGRNARDYAAIASETLLEEINARTSGSAQSSGEVYGPR